MVGALGNDSIMGVIPGYHRTQVPPDVLLLTLAWNERIREAALRTQNYDKGLNWFIPKFLPEEEMSAIVSVQEGHHMDHGWAVYCKQGSSRCFLLGTEYGMTTKEALWSALSFWATFQPGQASHE
jgi:hypothetical protein